ncbi:MAG: ATPase, T2SS/T4P/T4SS family [Fimbriimonadaceae bacterium]
MSDVITEYSRFPSWRAVLSGPHSEGALRVPDTLATGIAAVELDDLKVVICLSQDLPPHEKPRASAMRAELTGSGRQVPREYLNVTRDVLSSVMAAAGTRRAALGGEETSGAVAAFKRWVRQGLELGATDIHLEVRSGGRGIVRVRVDGELEVLPECDSLTSKQVHDVITAVYEQLSDKHSNSAGTFSAEKTMAAMIGEKLGIPGLRLRFSSQKGLHGPKSVLRFLRTGQNKHMSFDEIGYSSDHIKLLKRAQRRRGMVLFAGETGSGKSTAAAAFIATAPDIDKKAIYQIGDPIEYDIAGTHQIPVQRNLLDIAADGQKDPYTATVEGTFRMDPNWLDVGEVRDIVSARGLAAAAKGGHLSIGSTHAPSARSVVTKLTDASIGLTRAELCSTDDIIRLITYQTLVPLVCPHCSLRHGDFIRFAPRNSELIAEIEAAIGHGLNADAMRFRNPAGCPACRHRGTKGLTACAEMIYPDDSWLDYTLAGDDRAAWSEYRRNHSDKLLFSDSTNGKSAFEHGASKLAKGLIDIRSLLDIGSFIDYRADK